MNLAALRRVLGRLVVMIGGEAMQSAFHLGLNLALLHAVSAHDYGIFALVMVIGGIGLTYIRSLTALPASVAITQSRRPGAANAYEISFGAAATLLSLLFAAGVAIVLNAWLDEGILPGGAFIGLWAMRSHLRTVFFARDRQGIVSLSDIAFTASGAAGAVLVLVAGDHILRYTFLVLACANGLGVAVLLGLARRPVRIAAGLHLWRRYRKLWRDLKWSLLSVSITNLQGQGMALLVAAIAGPAAYAPIAAALVLFVPLRIVSTAFANMMHPEMSRLLQRFDVARIGRLFRLWPGALALAAMGYGLAAIVILPRIQPETLAQAHFYRTAFVAWLTCSIPMLYVLPRVWLEIRLDYRSIALLSALAAVVGLALVLVILFTTDPSWALIGSAVSELIVLLGSWAIVLRRHRAIRGRPTGGAANG
jgi:O-antigen/teichoic acid export membrane protein